MKWIYFFALAFICPALCTYNASADPNLPPAKPKADQPVELSVGPHLFLDDYLIANSENVERKVNTPPRFLDKPVITSAPEHSNWQPWFTVHYDQDRPTDKRFRVWYTADMNPDDADEAYSPTLAYLESADGIHWPGPYKALKSAEEVLWSTTVLDEGQSFSNPSERYKLLYWTLQPHRYGPMVAASPDGLNWTLKNNAKPVFRRLNSFDDSWHFYYDPIRKRYFMMRKHHTVHGWTNLEGQPLLKGVRTFSINYSDDLEHWSDHSWIFYADKRDPGSTEFYAVTGFQTRGDLIVGFIQLLRDDLRTDGAPDEAVYQNFGNNGAGMGWTALCWTHDGVNWYRDAQTDAFLAPNPVKGSWDHAMSWVSSSVPVGDDLYLYYAGYRWGHKFNRSKDRQIGLVKIKQDRYVARQAGSQPGKLNTPLVKLASDKLALNADAAQGEIRVQLTDEKNQPIPGYSFEDCTPIKIDSVSAPVTWKEPLTKLKGQPVHVEFTIKNARLFALNVQ